MFQHVSVKNLDCFELTGVIQCRYLWQSIKGLVLFISQVTVESFHVLLFNFHEQILREQPWYCGALMSVLRSSQRSPAITLFFFTFIWISLLGLFSTLDFIFVLYYPWSLIVYIDQDCLSGFLLLDFAHVLFQSSFLVNFLSILLPMRIAVSSMFYRIAAVVYLLFLK